MVASSCGLGLELRPDGDAAAVQQARAKPSATTMTAEANAAMPAGQKNNKNNNNNNNPSSNKADTGKQQRGTMS